MEFDNDYENKDDGWGFYIDIENPSNEINKKKKHYQYKHKNLQKNYNTFKEEENDRTFNELIERDNQYYKNLLLEQENAYFIIRNGSKAILTIAITFIVFVIL
jgi:hypothetical protein